MSTRENIRLIARAPCLCGSQLGYENGLTLAIPYRHGAAMTRTNWRAAMMVILNI